MARIRHLTRNVIPLLMAVGGLIGARAAVAVSQQQGASTLGQIGAALLVYTATVALLGRAGNEAPGDAIADATRALAHLLQTLVTGALTALCLAIQLLALLGGALAALAPAHTTH